MIVLSVVVIKKCVISRNNCKMRREWEICNGYLTFCFDVAVKYFNLLKEICKTRRYWMRSNSTTV